MNEFSQVTTEKKRPVFLTVLCVIAFVHVGLSIVIGLFGTLTTSNPEWFETSGLLDLFVWGAKEFGLFFSLILLILSIIAFFGIIQIWNQLKIGVWTFSIPMFLFIIIPLLALPTSFWFLLIPNLIIIPVLILLFIMNYRKLD
ncbi:MAG: hypothetical protein ABR597_02710 [Bacteroidales bacterium]